MNYKENTVFNFKIFYYLIRIFSIFWLIQNYIKYERVAKRSEEFYRTTYWLQEVFFPVFPSFYYYVGLLLVSLLFITLSLFRPKIIYNIILFFLLSLVNIPLAAYNGAGHHNHLFILSFFFSIFLLPSQLKSQDYKYVEYFYLGLLLSYSFAGIWKLVAIFNDLYSHSPSVSWIERDAAKLNTMVNWHNADLQVPEFMMQVYQYQDFWIVITFLGILFQALTALGAFSRKYLTFNLFYLVAFHLYNKYFVLADFTNAIYVVIILLFPYHSIRKKIPFFQ